MKRIAIFCDGTWNRPDATETTNVFKLHQSARQTAPDGVTQILKYIPGVGTGFGLSGIRRVTDRVAGGLFGVGVSRNILNAYRFLVEIYEPGDRIFIFGFSRGAFTARSLAGMIRASGLPPHDQAHRVGRALKRYRSVADETRPDTEESFRFRLGFSPNVATSKAEQDWRVAQGHPEPALLTIAYLGVWDTVGALGIPGHYKLLSRVFNRSLGFHDTRLSRSVLAARHAVSIDERRKSFPPTLWDNLGILNEAGDGGARRYRQLWFPGDHGSVGGGGAIRSLSSITLRWIAAGAEAEGLRFDNVAMRVFEAERDHMGALTNAVAKAGLGTMLLRLNLADRVGKIGPSMSWDISGTARRRWREDRTYRSPPLLPFREDLDGDAPVVDD